MKSNNLVRILDLCGQLLMLLPLLLHDNGFGCSNVTLTYCTVGGWQMISLLANWYGNPGSRPRRAGYAIVLRDVAYIAAIPAPLIVTGLFSGESSGICHYTAMVFVSVLMPYLSALLLLLPGLAIWYFCICVRELRANHAAAIHRREIHWKH